MSQPDASFAARYWGILNRLRETAIVCHASARAAHGPRAQRSLRIVVSVLVTVGLASLGALWFFWGSANFLVAASFALPGLTLVAFGARVVVDMRERVLEGSRYDARGAERTAWRRLFEDLAEEWNGTVTADGFAVAMRFLIENYPECAPTLLCHHQAGNDEDRITLVGRVEDAPLLVQLIDNSKHGAFIRPPALVVLLVSPIEMPPEESSLADAPFRTAGSKRIEDTAAYEALSERGFRVRWTSAGAYASHAGPLSPLDRDELAAIVRGLVDICKGAAAERPVVTAPSPPSIDKDELDEKDYESVAEAFLRALRDRDALGVLTLAHPMLFPRGPREPTPRDLDRAIDEARARPLRWKRGSLTTAGDVRRGVHAQFADRPNEEAHVNLSRAGDRWVVGGYTVGNELVIGLPYVEPSN